MSDFENDFLETYLKLGLGSLPKSDIDALVMHLLDLHGYDGSPPLSIYSNQTVSEKIKTPVSKVKRLRYDAALKFGGRIEDQAQGRLLAALSKASLEPEDDSLAKNWLQGQLKANQHIFDFSFNTEIVKVDATDLFSVLASVFKDHDITEFKDGYEASKKKANIVAQKKAFKSVAKKFAEGAAKAAGVGVVGVLKAHMGGI
jgi:hypothetical protein